MEKEKFALHPIIPWTAAVLGPLPAFAHRPCGLRPAFYEARIESEFLVKRLGLRTIEWVAITLLLCCPVIVGQTEAAALNQRQNEIALEPLGKDPNVEIAWCPSARTGKPVHD